MSGAGRIGVDVGGTFTDVVTVVDGELVTTKVPSTPDEPESGVFDGLDRSRRPLATVDIVEHGTTVATNAVLEREWARTAFVTTDGFRDVLEIGRQDRPELYNLDIEKPPVVVPRDRRFEVPERLGPRGGVREELNDTDLENIVNAVIDADVESVGICLLFAYENDEHERRVADAIAAADPSISISRSSAVHPEIREYERSLVTALNAALKPVIDRYLGRIEAGLGDRSPGTTLRVMQSNGGSVEANFARQRPVDTVLSGPAAGVQGAGHVASLAGHENVITMDMGGTSCDVSVIEGGEPVVSTDVTVGGYPIGRPMVEVNTIGAGGGSIAWIDDGGALRVGPRSAGANPGPICYGRGGSDPTVTDAQVALGRLDPEAFLDEGGKPSTSDPLDVIESTIADALGQDGTEAAAGILAVADANMERAIRVGTVERGLDPRDFALVAYGGAGPLHAASLARSLDIPTVLVPRAAGVLSALGLIITDHVREFGASRVRRWEEIDHDAIESTFDSFVQQGIEQLSEEGIPGDSIDVERTVELRYVGQSFSLRVPINGEIDDTTMGPIADRFHERHELRYGHASPDEPIELVTLRTRVRAAVSAPDLRVTDTANGSDPSPRMTRTVAFDGTEQEVDVYARVELGPGAVLEGPAVVEGAESTALVHPEQRATVDEYGTLAIRTDGGRS